MTLREARELAGLSQRALADRARTTATTISDLETGKNERPAYELVMRIIGALQRSGLRGLTPEQLFPLDDKEIA